MFRIDKSTVGSIDKKNPYVMEGIFARQPERQPDNELPPELTISLDQIEDPEIAALQAKQIEAGNAAAAAVIADARKQAQMILAEAQTKAEELRAQGWQEGYNKGTADAEVILKRLRKSDLADLNMLMMSVKETHARMIDESEIELLDIAIEAAKKIVGYELQKDEVYTSFIENALRRVRAEGKVRVFVDEDAYNRFIQTHGPSSIMRDAMEIIVSENPAYRPGDATITFGDESIDLSVDSQIEELKRELGLG